MFTVDLSKKMLEGRKKENMEDKILKEFNTIIENDEKIDKGILSRLGLDKNIAKAKEIIQEKNNLEKYKEYKVFHINEIKKVCYKYKLRFLPTESFKGEIPVELTAKVKEFEKKVPNHTKTKDYYYYEDYKYFIAAPRESFELQDRPKDPLLFVEIIADEYYILLYKWGNDLSITRRVLNLLTKGSEGEYVYYPIFYSVFAVLFCLGKFVKLPLDLNNEPIPNELFLVISFIILGVILLVGFVNDITERKQFRNKFKN